MKDHQIRASLTEEERASVLGAAFLIYGTSDPDRIVERANQIVGRYMFIRDRDPDPNLRTPDESFAEDEFATVRRCSRCLRFVLKRMEDESGMSGTGIVATGVVFPEGRAAMVWLTEHASTTFYPSITALVRIHSHGGKSVVEFFDPQVASDLEFPPLAEGDGAIVWPRAGVLVHRP